MKGLLIVPLLWMHDNSWATTPVSTSKLRRMRPQYLICTTKTQGLVFERWWMPLLCMFWHLPADLSTEHVNSAVQAAHKSTLESHHGHWRAYLYTCPHNHNSPRDDCLLCIPFVLVSLLSRRLVLVSALTVSVQCAQARLIILRRCSINHCKRVCERRQRLN